MNFGQALNDAVDHRKRISREGWNGKGMYIVYQEAYPNGIPINSNTAEATGLKVGSVCKFRPYLMMKSANDEFVPWVASQSDILADDWKSELKDN